jgi:DNA-binding NarL/FixJ family response regulator
VIEGKTNGQIGLILNASSRTIQKHLEHIFQKLGVETRTSSTVRTNETGILATISMAIS